MKSNVTGAAGSHHRFSGDDCGGATPDPIPNSEVKPSSADGTAWVTVWESRTLPDLWPGLERDRAFFIGCALVVGLGGTGFSGTPRPLPGGDNIECPIQSA